MRRIRFGDFFSRMWLENARRPRSFPRAVLRNRFLAPEWVFIFGIGRLLKQTRARARAGDEAAPGGWLGGGALGVAAGGAHLAVAGLRPHRREGMSYSQLIHGLDQAGVEVNRKMLADVAVRDPEAFRRFAELAREATAA